MSYFLGFVLAKLIQNLDLCYIMIMITIVIPDFVHGPGSHRVDPAGVSPPPRYI